jgi:hypothetical protein
VLIINTLVWWPGTDLNRRRQPFQGCQINHLQTMFYENTGLTRERFGLHLDARGVLDSKRTPHRSLHGRWRLDCLARDRLAFLVSSNECEDNINISIYVVTAWGIPTHATVVSGSLRPRRREGDC